MRAALGAGVAQADEKLEGSQKEWEKWCQGRLSLKRCDNSSLTPVFDYFMMGASAAPMRCICAGFTMSPRIFMKRSFCTPETMYCQR